MAPDYYRVILLPALIVKRPPTVAVKLLLLAVMIVMGPRRFRVLVSVDPLTLAITSG